ncbi:MAG: YqgE/AlgH family protein [Pseudomonadota bacterium]
MEPIHSLSNQFLIAMPRLQDSNFARTVTLVCEHNTQGAMGIVVNRPMSIKLGEMLRQLEIPLRSRTAGEQFIHVGGPVQPDRGFVLHSSGLLYDSTLQVGQQLSITTSKDILEAIARDEGPKHSLIALGYAGWGEGQLENELIQNTWLSCPAAAEIIFKIPVERRWHAAAALLGVNLSLISSEAGHA